MKWKVTTAPTATAIEIDDARRHCRYDLPVPAEVNAHLASLISAATQFVERRLELALLTQTITATCTRFPMGRKRLQLPMTNLLEVESVKYVDENGDEQTVATTVYGVDTLGRPGGVFLKAEQDWPTDVADQENAVTVVYSAGYGESADDVPEQAKHAIRLLVGHWDAHREAVAAGEVGREVAMAVDSLCGQLRVMGL